MTDKVSIYRDEAGQYRWRRKAPNGEPISSGESYTTKSHAIDGAFRANPDIDELHDGRRAWKRTTEG